MFTISQYFNHYYYLSIIIIFKILCQTITIIVC